MPLLIFPDFEHAWFKALFSIKIT